MSESGMSGDAPTPSPMSREQRALQVRQIVADHEVELMRFAYRQTGQLELAREIVQDAFLKLWEAEESIFRGRVLAWLYTVCRHRAIDVRRKERRMSTIDTTDSNTRPDAAAGSPADGRSIEQEEGRTAVLRAISQLPDRQQEVVRLRFQSGLSYREMAEVLDITVNHVGVLLHSAMKTLRSSIPTGSDGSEAAPNASAGTNPEVAR